jgi:hypothetical protein
MDFWARPQKHRQQKKKWVHNITSKLKLQYTKENNQQREIQSTQREKMFVNCTSDKGFSRLYKEIKPLRSK